MDVSRDAIGIPQSWSITLFHIPENLVVLFCVKQGYNGSEWVKGLMGKHVKQDKGYPFNGLSQDNR